MAICKLYEVQGSDASRTAGAVRCHREAVDVAILPEGEFPICERHAGDEWVWFVRDRWFYAIVRSEGPHRR